MAGSSETLSSELTITLWNVLLAFHEEGTLPVPLLSLEESICALKGAGTADTFGKMSNWTPLAFLLGEAPHRNELSPLHTQLIFQLVSQRI